MKIFWPKSLYVPSPCGTARVRTAARSEPGLRLGQVHRAGPRAGHHLRQELVLERLSVPRSSIASIAPCVSSGHRSNARFAACHISSTAVDDELRQSLAAVLGVLGEAVPAVRAILLVRVLESGRRLDGAAFEPLGAFAVAGHVERIEHVGRELRRFLENRRDGVGRRVLESGQLRDLRRVRPARSSRTAFRPTGRGRCSCADQSGRSGRESDSVRPQR